MSKNVNGVMPVNSFISANVSVGCVHIAFSILV